MRPTMPYTRAIPRSIVFLLLAALALPAASAAAAARSRPAGYEGSRWWDEVDSIEALLDEGKWRKALRLAERLSGRVVARSWQEPDLDRVLATLSFQRAVAEAALGRETDALWHWHAAVNLAPGQAEESLAELTADGGEGTRGEVAALFGEAPLRQPGRLPDGSLPPQLPMPGYQPPVDVPRPVCPFDSDWATRVRHLPVRVEVVIDREGRLRQPLVLSETSHPVPTFWTLEAIRTGSDVHPARLDGEPIPTVEEVLMEFDRPKRW